MRKPATMSRSGAADNSTHKTDNMAGTLRRIVTREIMRGYSRFNLFKELTFKEILYN
jgi:hypothetical protein